MVQPFFCDSSEPFCLMFFVLVFFRQSCRITDFAKKLCFLLIRNIILRGKILSLVTLVLAQSCAGLMRTELDPRNLSGRLCYIPHTRKHVYREMYTFFYLFGFLFFVVFFFSKTRFS